MPGQTKSDGDKASVKFLDYCMNALDYCIPTRPDITSYWLIKAFQIKRAWCKCFPDEWMNPSQQLAQSLALNTVTSALEKPEDSVFTSIFMPNEIFHALGLRPLIAEAVADFIAGAHAELGFTIYAEEHGVPQTYCSFHKVLLGATMAEVFGVPPLITNCSVACDANNLTFRMLAKRFDTEHVYVDVPADYDEEGCEYVAEQLEEMAHAAEDCYGRKLDEDLLKEKVARSQRTLDLLTRSMRLRTGRYIKNNMGLEMQFGLCFHTMLGEESCERLARLMLKDYLGAEPFDGVNLVWSSTTPFFCIQLQRLMDVNTEQLHRLEPRRLRALPGHGGAPDQGLLQRPRHPPRGPHARDLRADQGRRRRLLLPLGLQGDHGRLPAHGQGAGQRRLPDDHHRRRRLRPRELPRRPGGHAPRRLPRDAPCEEGGRADRRPGRHPRAERRAGRSRRGTGRERCAPPVAPTT